MVFEFEGSFLIKKRLKGDIWQGLYDFHLVEKGQTLDTENLIEDLEYLQAQNSLILKQESKVFKHLLSHQTIFAKFYHFELKNRVLFEQIATELSLEVHSLEKIHNLPKPILIKNYIDEFI